MRERISINPKVCHGKACVRGTRVFVAVVPDNLTAGLATDEIVHAYPTLQPEDIPAVLAYAADPASERVVPAPNLVLAA